MKYYARSKQGKNGEVEWQLLSEHLRCVSEMARRYGESIQPNTGFAARTALAGLLHDLGKYTTEFQEMLQGDRPRGVEHSGHGAAYVFQKGLFDIALAISGHHAGLADPTNIRQRAQRVEGGLQQIIERASRDMGINLVELEKEVAAPLASKNKEAFDVHTRMLYSCLVEADRTDAAGLGWSRHTLTEPQLLLDRVLKYIRVQSQESPEGRVKEIRQEILKDCLAAASWPERLLSLSAPTGGGKTLASMAFALKRALRMPNNGQRIIVVIPFLSIIEQTARVYRKALGDGVIVEHHCAIDNREEDGEDNPKRYQEAGGVPEIENWDAPIIITTSVRFFETVFSNKPANLRRMHNIANAIIILDEVQTLPRHYVNALLAMMKRLADDWGTTFLFCTATQPAFEKGRTPSKKDNRWPENTVREVLQRDKEILESIKRVNVFWPGESEDLPARCTTDDLAEFMAGEKRVLVIVNLKRHALALYETMREYLGTDHDGLFHLSSRMCPQHRLDTLEAVRERLTLSDMPCRLVATQLVEAGVDIDFPVVLRAMGPLDSIAQAAGRCDREGRMTQTQGRPAGRLYLFEWDTDNKMPPGAYTDAATITRMLMPLDIFKSEDLHRFFDVYFDHDLDQRDIQALRNNLNFRGVGENFVMIDNKTTSVLTPYNEEAARLIGVLERQQVLTRNLIRKLQRYQVGLFPQEKRRAFAEGAIYELYPESGIFACDARHYATDTGFHIDSDEPMIG